jgi:hypothetical protein
MSMREPTGKSKKKKTGGLPEPESGGDFAPFLKAGDIGKIGKTAIITVLGPPVETESEFSDAVMPVKFKGSEYALGIKWNGGNYSRLFKRFGRNERKWKGQVKVEVKHFKKNDYVAVV